MKEFEIEKMLAASKAPEEEPTVRMEFQKGETDLRTRYGLSVRNLRLPWFGQLRETHVATLQAIVSEEPTPPRRLNPQVDRDLEAICLKAVEKAPHRRYRSSQAFADDLEAFLAGRPIQARTSTALSPRLAPAASRAS